MKKNSIMTIARIQILCLLFIPLSCTNNNEEIPPERNHMILATLDKAEEYVAQHPGFAEAFEFLQQENLPDLAPGKYELAGDRLFCTIAIDSGKTREEANLEAHRRYIDIQYVIAGDEEMGWKPTAECFDVKSPYDVEKDILFFNDAAKTWTTVPPGSFVIFFPEDAHAPMVGKGNIHKVVCKILKDF